MVDVRFERALSRYVSLEEMKAHRDGALSGLLLLSRPRLSVQPVSDEHAAFILGLEAHAPPPESPKRATKKARKEGS
ncbi:hypothetical protein FOA52_006613 [Chlamydomonas sp. UWO 241]|nr:hypothetical protein FOA52_006613 [Chlamydomonas sp. UWO 241]